MHPFGRLPGSSLSQTRKVETSFLKEAPQKTLRVSDPTRTSPFIVHTRKEAPAGNVPMGAIPLKAVTSHFLRQVISKLQRFQGPFLTHNRGRGRGNPSSQ